MFYSLIIVNAFLLAFLLKSQLRPSVTGIISFLVVALQVYWAPDLLAEGGVEAELAFNSYRFTYPYVLILMGIVLGLLIASQRWFWLLGIVPVWTLIVMSFLKYGTILETTFDPAVAESVRIGCLVFQLLPFFICVVTSLMSVQSAEETVYKRYFALLRTHTKAPDLQLILGMGFLYLSHYAVWSIVHTETIFVQVPWPPDQLILYAAVAMMFYALVDQIVFVLLVDRTLSRVSFIADRGWLRMVAIVAVFVSARLYDSVDAAVWSIIPGLVFALLYVRTHSLSYGLLLLTLSNTFLR